MKINVFLFFKNMKTSLFGSSEIRFEAVVTISSIEVKRISTVDILSIEGGPHFY